MERREEGGRSERVWEEGKIGTEKEKKILGKGCCRVKRCQKALSSMTGDLVDSFEVLFSIFLLNSTEKNNKYSQNVSSLFDNWLFSTDFNTKTL